MHIPKSFLAILCLSAASLVHAQEEPKPDDLPPIRKNESITYMAIGATEAVQQVFTSYADLKEGHYKINSTGQEFDVKRTYGALSFYPLSPTSVAGNIYDPGSNTLAGGTRTIQGMFFGGSFGVRAPHTDGGSLEVGAFYFLPKSSSDGNFYQVNLKYFPIKNLGGEIGYFSNTSGPSFREYALHLVYRYDAAGAPLHTQVGIGTYLNPDGSSSGGQTYNFSAFTNLAFDLGKRFQLLGTYWYLRDRNLDVTRFSIGFGFKI